MKTKQKMKNCLIMRFDTYTVSLQYSQCFDFLLISVAASSEDKASGDGKRCCQYSQCFDYLLISVPASSEDKASGDGKRCCQYSQCFDYLLISVPASSEDKASGDGKRCCQYSQCFDYLLFQSQRAVKTKLQVMERDAVNTLSALIIYYFSPSEQ